MKCDRCKAKFKVDIFVPSWFWQTIKPLKERRGGYLCPACILAAVEAAGVICAELVGFIRKQDLDALAMQMKSKRKRKKESQP